jgi:uncharacterized protein
MTFEWDTKKNESNFEKHGLDFADAEQFFTTELFVRLDTRKKYGELRWQVFGLMYGRLLVLAFTKRGEEIIRVISFRPANRRERNMYAKEIAHGLGAR